MPKFRLRTESRRDTKLQTIGRHYQRSSVTGECTKGATHQAVVGPGYEIATFDELHGKPPYREGGPFCSIRKQWATSVVGTITAPGGLAIGGAGLNAISKEIGRGIKPGETWNTEYKGGVVLRPPQGYVVPDMALKSHDDYTYGVNSNDLTDLGTRGYNRLRPKLAGSNVLQSLAELGQTPGMLRPLAAGFKAAWEQQLRQSTGRQWRRYINNPVQAPRDAAGAFLAVQFGWVPFVSDVVSVIDTSLNYNSLLAKNQAMNGKWRRRRFAEDELQSSTVLYEQSTSGLSPGTWTDPSLSQFASGATMTITRETYARIWYEGVFSAYYSEFDKVPPAELMALQNARRALAMYGIRFSPTQLFKIVPFTWLADWFVDISGNLQRVEDAMNGNVVSKYFYLMRETHARIRYTLTVKLRQGGSYTFTAFDGVSVKRRVEGQDHYGFSVNPNGLSANQIAILVALGLS